MKRFWMAGLALWVAVAVAAPCRAAEPGSFDGRFRELSSRLQAMQHGPQPEADWQSLMGDLADLESWARASGEPSQVVEVGVLRSMLYADLWREYGTALRILSGLLDEMGDRPVSNLNRVYVRMAEVHARLGDAAAIRGLIDRFRRSPHFDPVRYPYSGGQGRGVPLSVTRPRSAGTDSITVTAMEKLARQARFQAGQELPEFRAADLDGREIRSAELAGDVVLIDVWHPDWGPWRRDLENLKTVAERFGGQGLRVLGFCLERDPDTARDFARRHGMRWTQAAGDPRLLRDLGVYGECTNFLVNRQGRIVGRDLRGADLLEAVRNAL